nr:unnamed protein product [Callosobruchus analis]
MFLLKRVQALSLLKAIYWAAFSSHHLRPQEKASRNVQKKQELKEEQEKEKENRKRKNGRKNKITKKEKEDYENNNAVLYLLKNHQSGDDDLYLAAPCYKLSDIDEEEVDELYEQYQQERKLYYR